MNLKRHGNVLSDDKYKFRICRRKSPKLDQTEYYLWQDKPVNRYFSGLYPISADTYRIVHAGMYYHLTLSGTAGTLKKVKGEVTYA